MGRQITKSTKIGHVPYAKFKAYMQEENIKQEDLAELIGKAVSTVNRNINGTGGDFSMKDIRIICETYNISADTFFITQKVS